MTPEELQKLVESNAKSIEALTSRQSDLSDRIADTAEITRQHGDQIIALAELVARYSLEAAADRREMRRSIDEIKRILQRQYPEPAGE